MIVRGYGFWALFDRHVEVNSNEDSFAQKIHIFKGTFVHLHTPQERRGIERILPSI